MIHFAYVPVLRIFKYTDLFTERTLTRRVHGRRVTIILQLLVA
jgi:hypothetical protein